MEYIVQVTVRVCSDTVNDAHNVIRHALSHAKLAEIVYLDSEVLESMEEESDYSEDVMRESSLWQELRKQ